MLSRPPRAGRPATGPCGGPKTPTPTSSQPKPASATALRRPPPAAAGEPTSAAQMGGATLTADSGAHYEHCWGKCGATAGVSANPPRRGSPRPHHATSVHPLRLTACRARGRRTGRSPARARGDQRLARPRCPPVRGFGPRSRWPLSSGSPAPQHLAVPRRGPERPGRPGESSLAPLPAVVGKGHGLYPRTAGSRGT